MPSRMNRLTSFRPGKRSAVDQAFHRRADLADLHQATESSIRAAHQCGRTGRRFCNLSERRGLSGRSSSIMPGNWCFATSSMTSCRAPVFLPRRQYTWNDGIIALNQIAGVYTDAIGSLAPFAGHRCAGSSAGDLQSAFHRAQRCRRSIDSRGIGRCRMPLLHTMPQGRPCRHS